MWTSFGSGDSSVSAKWPCPYDSNLPEPKLKRWKLVGPRDRAVRERVLFWGREQNGLFLRVIRVDGVIKRFGRLAAGLEPWQPVEALVVVKRACAETAL